MELFSPEFWSALLAIILLDLVLAGDNAILIALAARNLPAHLQKKAVLWGTFGAIAVRVAMTMVVVWLLKIPGLMLAGGLALVWIAIKLAAPGDGEHAHDAPAATTFMGAMKTIVVADALMGLDNVLAVAGAAHGNFVLVVLGLLISIPIVIWGSTFVLKMLERYPAIVYLGTAVLALTAAKMVISDPIVRDWIDGRQALVWAAYALGLAVVLSATLYLQRRNAEKSFVATHRKENAMPKVLIAVNSSSQPERIAEHLAKVARHSPGLEANLVYVTEKFPRHIARFASGEERDRLAAELAERHLTPIRTALEKARVSAKVEVARGAAADAISDAARRSRADSILIAMAMPITAMFKSRDELASELHGRTQLPVSILPGRTAGMLERMAVPTGIGAVLVALALD